MSRDRLFGLIVIMIVVLSRCVYGLMSMLCTTSTTPGLKLFFRTPWSALHALEKCVHRLPQLIAHIHVSCHLARRSLAPEVQVQPVASGGVWARSAPYGWSGGGLRALEANSHHKMEKRPRPRGRFTTDVGGDRSRAEVIHVSSAAIESARERACPRVQVQLAEPVVREHTGKTIRPARW